MEVDEILASLESGGISRAEARRLLSLYSIERIEGGIANIDVDRQRRRGVPEVVFAETKRVGDVKRIIERAVASAGRVVVSRIREEDAGEIADFAAGLGYDVAGGTNCSSVAVYGKGARKKGGGGVVGVLAAGTSDVGVAEEARLVAEAMGCTCITGYDVGVAGMHRVLPVLKEFVGGGADAAVVVAGMEGALPTLVASLVDIPVIGVPVSVGYGYGGGGVAALASMLQSCSLGMAVVNIDNGIAAGVMAANIANRAAAGRRGGGGERR